MLQGRDQAEGVDVLKKSKGDGKPTGILVHTSGTAEFGDGTKEGKYWEGTRVWNVSVLSPRAGYVKLMGGAYFFHRTEM